MRLLPPHKSLHYKTLFDYNNNTNDPLFLCALLVDNLFDELMGDEENFECLNDIALEDYANFFLNSSTLLLFYSFIHYSSYCLGL